MNIFKKQILIALFFSILCLSFSNDISELPNTQTKKEIEFNFVSREFDIALIEKESVEEERKALESAFKSLLEEKKSLHEAAREKYIGILSEYETVQRVFHEKRRVYLNAQFSCADNQHDVILQKAQQEAEQAWEDGRKNLNSLYKKLQEAILTCRSAYKNFGMFLNENSNLKEKEILTEDEWKALRKFVKKYPLIEHFNNENFKKLFDGSYAFGLNEECGFTLFYKKVNTQEPLLKLAISFKNAKELCEKAHDLAQKNSLPKETFDFKNFLIVCAMMECLKSLQVSNVCQNKEEFEIHIMNFFSKYTEDKITLYSLGDPKETQKSLQTIYNKLKEKNLKAFDIDCILHRIYREDNFFQKPMICALISFFECFEDVFVEH